MAKPKLKTEYREGTLGWYLVEAGWTPVEPMDCPASKDGAHHKDTHGHCDRCDRYAHPLWQFGDIGELKTGWEARRLELVRIHNEFKSGKIAAEVAADFAEVRKQEEAKGAAA
jgi:hypothetical protein